MSSAEMRGRERFEGTQSGSHVFSERLICVFSEGSSLTIALLLNSLGATGRFPAATGSPPHSRSRSMSRWKYPENIVENIRFSVRLARRWHELVVGPEVCSGLRWWTWTAVRQVPLAEEPLRSRLCLLLPARRFCVTRHGKIFRIFTDIFRGIHTWACRKSPEGRNFLDEDERKCLTYCNWRGAKTQTKPRKRCQVDLIKNKLQKLF